MTAYQEHQVLGEKRIDVGYLNLSSTFEMVFRRLPIILLCTIIGGGAAVFWGRSQPPMYEGNFSILIEPVTAESEVASAISGEQVNVSQQDVGSSGASSNTGTLELDYATQVQILRSPGLLKPLFDSLLEANPSIKTDNPSITVESFANSIGIERKEVNKKPTKILEVTLEGESKEQLQEILSALSKTYIDYSYKERQTNVRRSLAFVERQMPIAQAQMNRLERELQTFREQNRIVDPKDSSQNLINQISEVDKALKDNQIDVKQTQQLYTSLQNQTGTQPTIAEAGSVLSDSPDYQKVSQELRDAQVEYNASAATLQPGHPRLIELQQTIAYLQPLLEQMARKDLGDSLYAKLGSDPVLPYQNSLRQDLSKQLVATSIRLEELQARQQGLQRAYDTLIERYRSQPGVVRKYEELQRNLQFATNQLSKFLEVREELMITATRQEIPWELISPVLVKEVPNSSLLQKLILGTILGSVLGLGISLLIDKAYGVVYNLEDLKSNIRWPILGTIPYENHLRVTVSKYLFPSQDLASSENESDIFLNPLFHFNEAFRSLYSQIRLIRPDKPVRSVVISSLISSEGKTTVSLGLAEAAAAMGQRVLLVDADLRKNANTSSFSHDLGYAGLSEIISDELSLDEAIVPLGKTENLFLLSSGLIPSDPTGLLGSNKMQNIINMLGESFDFIIYDTSSLEFADSLLLTPNCDGILIVTKLNTTPIAALKKLEGNVEFLQGLQGKVLGLAVNGLKISHQKNYYYTNTQQNYEQSHPEAL